MAYYERALTCDARHADTLCNYGFLHLSLGVKGAAKAEELFNRCLEVLLSVSSAQPQCR